MTFEEIIRSFAVSETVPVDAIRAALDAPAAFVDHAIPLLERMAARQTSDIEDAASSVLVHVLGEIGDRRAFLPLMAVLALPPDEIEYLLGDIITETLGGILISLVGDDASALEEMLADTRVYEFVRSAVFEAWTWLVLTGKVPMDRARALLLDYPIRVGLDETDFGWSSWVDSVTALGLVETRDLARRHLPQESDKGSIFDACAVTYQDFEHQLAQTLTNPERWREDPRYQAFADTIGELSGWHGYSEEHRKQRAKRSEPGLNDEMLDTPYIAFNPFKDVGRNEPCPCGSGKKFKKCCLNDPGSFQKGP